MATPYAILMCLYFTFGNFYMGEQTFINSCLIIFPSLIDQGSGCNPWPPHASLGWQSKHTDYTDVPLCPSLYVSAQLMFGIRCGYFLPCRSNHEQQPWSNPHPHARELFHNHPLLIQAFYMASIWLLLILWYLIRKHMTTAMWMMLSGDFRSTKLTFLLFFFIVIKSFIHRDIHIFYKK